MARKKIYGEAKRRLTLTLTDTAIEWLEAQQTELTGSSLSDAIERMARQQPKPTKLSPSKTEK